MKEVFNGFIKAANYFQARRGLGEKLAMIET